MPPPESQLGHLLEFGSHRFEIDLISSILALALGCLLPELGGRPIFKKPVFNVVVFSACCTFDMCLHVTTSFCIINSHRRRDVFSCISSYPVSLSRTSFRGLFLLRRNYICTICEKSPSAVPCHCYCLHSLTMTSSWSP